MMNDLNSVLIEGALVSEPKQDYLDGKAICRFQLSSKRVYKDDSGEGEQTTTIKIETSGKLSEFCINQGRQGRRCRAVGRIVATNGDAYIVAEHIEFRPELEK
jgi:single-stranded DNA-binding protein